jgi:hypothetical protein
MHEAAQRACILSQIFNFAIARAMHLTAPSTTSHLEALSWAQSVTVSCLLAVRNEVVSYSVPACLQAHPSSQRPHDGKTYSDPTGLLDCCHIRHPKIAHSRKGGGGGNATLQGVCFPARCMLPCCSLYCCCSSAAAAAASSCTSSYVPSQSNMKLRAATCQQGGYISWCPCCGLLLLLLLPLLLLLCGCCCCCCCHSILLHLQLCAITVKHEAAGCSLTTGAPGGGGA